MRHEPLRDPRVGDPGDEASPAGLLGCLAPACFQARTPQTLILRLVAPTGFEHDASAFELEFEGLALAA